MLIVYALQQVVSYVDLLPYNDEFKYYYITCFPVFHPCGEVVAIQSLANEGKFWGVQNQVAELLGITHRVDLDKQKFTKREHEILFLLCYGATQDQIAQVLSISRSTVASIILKQLCVKFGISGSNTRQLSWAAMNAGFHQTMPKSLYRPCVIVLNKFMHKACKS